MPILYVEIQDRIWFLSGIRQCCQLHFLALAGCQCQMCTWRYGIMQNPMGYTRLLACRQKIIPTSNLKLIIFFLVLHLVLLHHYQPLSFVASMRRVQLTLRVYLRLAIRPSAGCCPSIRHVGVEHKDSCGALGSHFCWWQPWSAMVVLVVVGCWRLTSYLLLQEQ